MTQSTKGIIYKISKHFQTTIIGNIARFEDNFGYLWGHNSNKPLTDKQKEFLDLWEYTRTAILNHGNNQMREAIDSIVKYLDEENSQLRYKLTLINPNYLNQNRKEDDK